MDDKFLRDMRDKIYSGEDRGMYLHIGYFMMWFSAVELILTHILASVLHIHDYDAFEILARGMDARIKLERLRQACSLRGHTLGQNLDARLSYLEKKVIPIRNNLTHSWVFSYKDDEILHFGTLARMPFKEAGLPQVGKPSKTIKTLELFEVALWLNYLFADLRTIDKKKPPKILEIEKPQTSLPKEFLESFLQRAARASADKPAQKQEKDNPAPQE